MKKNLHGVCALAVTASILLATLSACGERMERTGLNASTDAQTTTAVNINSGAYNNQGSFNQDSFNQGAAPDSGNQNIGAGSNSGGNVGGNSGSGNNSGGSDSKNNAGSNGNSSNGNSGGNNQQYPTPTTADSTTGTGEKTTRTPTYIPCDPEKVLNSAKLTPMSTNDSELDERINKILAESITPNMSTYQKVRAVYNYLVQNFDYGYMAPRTNEVLYYSVYDTDVVSRSKTFLKTKRGTCIDFSAAFMTITRKIGLESYLVTGQTINKYGETSFHGWNVIRINGKDYGFDPEGDFRFSDSGKSETKYAIFCVDDPVKFNKNYTNLAAASFMKFKTIK